VNGTRIAPHLSVTLADLPASASPSTRAASQAAAGRWRRFVAAIPLRTALAATAAVWTLGCVWSFREQALFAQAKGFHIPWLLPAVIDGLAIALACVAYAASLDGRPGVVARLGTAVAVAASAASNATFAEQRTGGDTAAVVIAAGVPVAANLAFEVLLHELRRQVMRRRGLPAPAAVPYPRLIRVMLAPWSTLAEWRRLVLDLTALRPAFDAASAATRTLPDATQDSVTLVAPPVAIRAPASRDGVSDTAPASDTPARVTADAPASADSLDTCASGGATHPRADALAAPVSASGLASANAPLAQALTAGTRQFGSSGVRQVSDTDLRTMIHSGACRCDANADAGVLAGARQLIQTGARQGGATDAAPTPDARTVIHSDACQGDRADASAGTDAAMLSLSGDTGGLAEEARQLYRASVAANQALNGRQLGRMYARSPSWGRERIAEAKAQDRQAQQRTADGTGSRADDPCVQAPR